MTLYLGSKDFTVRNQMLYVNSATGNVLVFFKKSDCVHCKNFEPIFQACAASDSRVEWAVADLDRNPEIITKSRQTRNPIKGVPCIMMFIGGATRAVYTNSRDRSRAAILQFLNDVLSISGVNAAGGQPQQNRFIPQSQQQQQFTSQQPQFVQRPNYQQPTQSQDSSTMLGSAEYVPYNIPWKSVEQTN